MKRARGCGVAPSVGREWNDALAEEWLARNGAERARYAPYRLANLGNVSRALGWLWPCCPRYYASLADHEARSLAREALEIADWREDGALDSLLGGVLASGTVDLVEWARALSNQIEHDRLEESRQSKTKR